MSDLREFPITAHLSGTHTPHTSLPWHVGDSFDFEADKLLAVRDAGGDIVADALFARDAAYIVHAANLYPELIAALRELLRWSAGSGMEVGAARQVARELLAKAEQGVTHGA